MAIALLAIFCSTVYSNSIFVNPTSGHDITGTGTISNPYKSLKKAGQIAQGGDTIYIRGGHHLTFKDEFRRLNNTNNEIMNIMPYNNEVVILDGLGANFTAFWEGILTIQSSRNIEVRNLQITNNDSSSGIRLVSDISISRNIKISGCKVSNTFRQGILIQAKEVTVENCEVSNAVIRNTGGTAPSFWEAALCTYPYPSSIGDCENITFRNNYVHNAWGEGIALVRAKNFLIENNKVEDCFSAYIYLDNCQDGVIRNNFVKSNNYTYNRIFKGGYSQPGVGVFWAAEGNDYVSDRIVENIEIYNNLIIRTGPAFGWFDDDFNNFPNDSYRNIKIYYNTVFNTIGYESFYLEPEINPSRIPPSGCEFYNNILCRAKYSSIMPVYRNYFTESNDYNTAWEFRNNCFIHGYPPGLNNKNNITGHPLFLDSNSISSVNNFKVRSNSNCINSGIQITGITTDYFGTTRKSTPTIGFYEWTFGSGINQNPSNDIPKSFSLKQNYPNPFNPNTKIGFNLPEKAYVKLKVYDITGKEITELVNQNLNSGSYRYNWNPIDLSSGVYFYELIANDFTKTKRMLLAK